MDRDTAEAVAARFDDDPTVYACDWAGGLWGVEAQTDHLDGEGNIVYLTVGSDDDGNALGQLITLRTGQLTDDHIPLGVHDSDVGAIAAWIEKRRHHDIDTLLSMHEPW